MEETITIKKREYDRLKDRELFLNMLEAAGVDNWQGFGDAHELYDEQKKEME